MTSTTTGATTYHHPFRASDHQHNGKPHLLIACTGSVATIKLPLILHALSKHPISIRVILTDAASRFLQAQSHEQPPAASLLTIPNVEAIYHDRDEWSSPPWIRGAPILHIELRRWAHLFLIAPLSANSLAKLATGFADTLVLSVARAWDTTGLIDGRVSTGSATTHAATAGTVGKAVNWKKLIVVAPAMNTAMWTHPVTAKQIAVLEHEWGVEQGGWVSVLRPVEKELACGDTGAGAMRDWNEIVAVVEGYLGLNGTTGGESEFAQLDCS